MAAKSRIQLEVGSYSSLYHFAVIGTPVEYYLWYKPGGAKGVSSEWFKGREAFLHFNKMRELLNTNKNPESFSSYLSDLYHTNVHIPKEV